jgi:putative RNA 2'-phosphotransferase
MRNEKLVRLSKRMSRHLRHAPEEIGLRLDPAGWVEVEDLLAALGVPRADLLEVVTRNDKQRFAFSSDGRRIRANQGHSVAVRLGLPAVEPPAVLHHGTVARFLPEIMRDGLRPMNRHDVHLSPDVRTAQRVGARRGEPVVLQIDAAAMHADGYEFRVSDNGVWLTAAVPTRYIRTSGVVSE